MLVRIRAAGVNPVEAYIRAGTYAKLPSLPYTPGAEGTGDVEAVGEGVTKFKVRAANFIHAPALICLDSYRAGWGPGVSRWRQDGDLRRVLHRARNHRLPAARQRKLRGGGCPGRRLRHRPSGDQIAPTPRSLHAGRAVRPDTSLLAEVESRSARHPERTRPQPQRQA